MSGVEIDKSFRLASVLYGCADSRFFVSLQLDKPWLASKKNIINFVNSLTPSQAESLIVNFIPFVKEEKESLQEQVRRSCCVMELICQKFNRSTVSEIFGNDSGRIWTLWIKVEGNLAKLISVIGENFRNSLKTWSTQKISQEDVNSRYNISSTPNFCSKPVEQKNNSARPPEHPQPSRSIGQLSALFGKGPEHPNRNNTPLSPRGNNPPPSGMAIRSPASKRQQNNFNLPAGERGARSLAQLQAILGHK